MADVKKKRQRKPIGGGSFRKNQPPPLTPYWHPEVAEFIEGCKAKMAHDEMLPGFDEFGVVLPGGDHGFWADAERKRLLSISNVNDLAEIIRIDAGALMSMNVVPAIQILRARAKNAVGREEWEAAAWPFELLRDALMGLGPDDDPGSPEWFLCCMRREYEATLKDVKESSARYGALAERERRSRTFEEFLSQEVGVKIWARAWRAGTNRELALALIATRWGATAATVENWLKPSRTPGIKYKGDLPVEEFNWDGEKFVYDPNEFLPERPRRGRPKKREPRGWSSGGGQPTRGAAVYVLNKALSNTF